LYQVMEVNDEPSLHIIHIQPLLSLYPMFFLFYATMKNMSYEKADFLVKKNLL
jgi:hypothetical protein